MRVQRFLLALALVVGVVVISDGRLADGSGIADPAGTAVRVLTEPDLGRTGRTLRWRGPVVRVGIDLPGYPAWFIADAASTLEWIASATGLEVALVEANHAELLVVPGRGQGAEVRVRIDAGAITSAVVRVGCCRRRALREDLLQAFGPLGDHAPPPSLFSNDVDAETPTAFDRWVLAILYRLPPDSSATAVRRCAEASVPWLHGGSPTAALLRCPLG